MANFNKVILIGRLTREPETRAFANGGMVAKIGFAVSGRKKNAQTGQWEDDPMFIDIDVFNRGEFGKLADLVRDTCHKGSQIMVEGKLLLEKWNDKTTGEKKSKHKIVAEAIQLLDPRPDGQGGGGMNRPAAASGGGFSHPDDGPEYDQGPSTTTGDTGDPIPF